MFHGSSLEYIVPSSNLRGREIVEFLREQCSHSALDVLPFMRIKTFQNICNLMFGDETPESIPQEPELLERIVKNIVWGFELWSRRIATPWLFSNRIFNLLYKKDIEEITEVHQHFLKAPVEVNF
ncbi:uncharacterized protein LOC128985091 [Macrosteles quadrilineatus]|uniref:uncharacterized protein LOC128985091 n=1 Tax=Macrosteles quadrilineatus TaxID=74068 RepID=UPI0023E322C2|nr:uncharacterized protein LOC128985091 [Macrosteles quadrilineatus]